MKKILFSLLLLLSFLDAQTITNVSLLDKKNKCIYNDYYNKSGKFYYRYLTSSNTWRSTTSTDYSLSIINGYQFDDNTSVCSPTAWRVMGMLITDYHFLNALIGLLFGFFMLVVVSYLFMTVGGKK